MYEKKAAVICDRDSEILKMLAGTDGIAFTLTGIDNIPSDLECVLISLDHAGDTIGEMIKQARLKDAPIGVIANGITLEEQEALLDKGADDIILLPMPKKLLRQRILTLCGMVTARIGAVNFEMFDKIAEANKGGGSFIIQENDFENIYRFVTRLMERLDKKAQFLIFSLTSRSGFVETEAVLNFSNVVQTCLRRGDISSLYGSQIAVILIGADEENGKKIAKRLTETYYAHYEDDIYDIKYDIREINSRA